jgi:hypothetical protein
MSMACVSWVLAAAAFPLVAAAADGDAVVQPAVAKVRPAAYIKDRDAVRPADIAQAGMGSLDAAVGTQISNRSSPAWLALPASIAAPDSSIAWICGVGFLGFVVVRRLNAAASY